MITAYSFGASTAAGSKDDEGGFVARLDRFLRDTDAGIAINHGIGGDTTDMMIERLPSVIEDMKSKTNPFVLVTLGINDVPRIVDEKPEIRVPLERHTESLKKILTGTAEIGDVLYLTQYPVDYAARSLDSQLTNDYVKLGEETARAAGVNVIDIFGMITSERFDEFIFEDGLHFNNRGHLFICNQIIEYLKYD
ncbi:MAG: GDSL-type esterase/lipase family protein [Dehalococcoidia bacterium]|nr:GDSL-type esterase/lipase family protein [Dehalococcoidia bacterium]